MIDREIAYIANIDTYSMLKDWEEPISVVTESWISKGLGLYKYLIFDTDEWVGYNYLEIPEIRTDGKIFNKEFKIK